MSSLAGQPAKVLRIIEATLHAIPCDDGLELHVITKDGTQVIIAGSDQLVLGATELLSVSDGNAMAAHRAGGRRALRLAEIKPTPSTAGQK